MPNLATDLARVMELLEKATPGPLFTDYGMTRVEVIDQDGRVVALVPRDDKWGRPFGETGAIAESIAAAFSFLRKYGPEIAETFKETPNG